MLFIPLFLLGCATVPEQAPPTQFIYIGWDEADYQQLFLTDQAGTPPTQLTFAPHGVADFATSYSTPSIVYAKKRGDGGSDLTLLNAPFDTAQETTLACAGMQCAGATWAHDGRRIVYEQRDLKGASPRLWWWDTITGDTIPVFHDENEIGYRPKISPHDTHLSYVKIPLEDGKPKLLEQTVVVFNFATGEQLMIPNNMNAVAEWHPTEQQFLLLELQYYGDQIGIHTLHVEMETQKVTDLSDVLLVEEASPRWSSDGEWVVFGRKTARVPMGHQLYLMRPDGTDLRGVTEDANINHGSGIFSADNKSILYQRYPLNTPQILPSLWLFDLNTNTEKEIISVGTRPQWLSQSR